MGWGDASTSQPHTHRIMVPEAFKVLPPLSPDLPAPPRAPPSHRVAPPVNRRDKTAFVILHDEKPPPPSSRSVSPSGRVSPFRGRGFREESTIRYVASRDPSPSPSPEDEDRRGRPRARLPVAAPRKVRASSTSSSPLRDSSSRIPKPISRRSSLSPNRATQAMNQVNRNKSMPASPSRNIKGILKPNGVHPMLNGVKPPITSKRLGPANNTNLNTIASKPPLPKSNLAQKDEKKNNVTSPNRKRPQPIKPEVTRSPSRIPRTRSVSRGKEGNVRPTSPTRAVVRASPRVIKILNTATKIDKEEKKPSTASNSVKKATSNGKIASKSVKSSSNGVVKGESNNIKNSSTNTVEKERTKSEAEIQIPPPVEAVVSTLNTAEEKTPTLEKKEVKEEPLEVSQPKPEVQSPPPTKPVEESKQTQQIDKKDPENTPEEDVVPEPTVTLVRTTTQPALELAQPDVIPNILAKEEQEISKSISEGPSVEDKCENPGDSRSEVLASVESVRSTTSVETVRAVARVKEDPEGEVLSADNLLKTDRNIAWENKSPEMPHMNNSVHPVLPLQPPKKTGCCGRLSDKLNCRWCGKCSCMKTPACCTGLGSRLTALCSKLNCCRRANCSCCKKTTAERPPPKPRPEQPSRLRNCLSKLNCFRWSKRSRRQPEVKAEEDEEVGTTGCCGGCKDRGKRCYSGLFCLNLACCQKLRSCCRCTRLACCRQGGCCGPSAPHLDRRKSRMSVRKSQTSISQGIAKLDPSLVEHQSTMRGAVPVLPVSLAWLCCMLNVFLPGTGTLMSGVFCLCFGKPRFSINDSYPSRFTAFCINVMVSVSQLFTVIFCLVGWGWSIWWGVMMVRFAKKNQRILLTDSSTEQPAVAPAPVVVNQNSVPNHDVERGR